MKNKLSTCCGIFIAYFWIFMYLGIFIMAGISEYIEVNDIKLNPNDWCHITDVDYQAVVTDEPNGHGKAIITERLTFDVHAASEDNGYWELWRDLPESYVDGVKVNYNVLSVKQILPDGQTIDYEASNKLYWDDRDYVGYSTRLQDGTYGTVYGPQKWYHSKGPYDPAQRRYECVLFYVDDIYREQMVFEVTYEMFNAALKYGDCSELYLSMYSEETIKHLNSFHGEILFPKSLMPKEGNYIAHTYGTNANDFVYVEDDYIHPGYHTFRFDLNQRDLKFSPYNQYLEFTLVSSGDDKHLFTQYASENDYTDENVLPDIIKEMKEYDQKPYVYAMIKFFLLLVGIYLSYRVINKTKKHDEEIRAKYPLYKPEFDFEYFRDIPSDLDPVFASFLVFCKDKKPKEIEDEYGALILSLVRKKYIRIEKIDISKDWIGKNTKIVILYNPAPPSLASELSGAITSTEDSLEPLTKSEKYFFDLIKRYAIINEITMKVLQEKISSDFVNTETFLENMKSIPKEYGFSNNYFQDRNYTKIRDKERSSAFWKGVWGILLITVGNYFLHLTRLDYALGALFLLGFSYIWSWRYLKKKSSEYLLLTQFGEDEYAKWHGLYQFLNNETLLNEAPIDSLGLWEKYLIYATAFGIPEKIINVLKVKIPEISVSSSPVLSNHYYRSASFRTNSRLYHSSVRSASARYHSSSYGGYGSYSYGGHGGYGGGGRGGGGGGGGH